MGGFACTSTNVAPAPSLPAPQLQPSFYGKPPPPKTHNTLPSQWQRTFLQNSRSPILRLVLHRNDYPPCPSHQVHRSAHPLHHLARNRPVGQVAVLIHLHRTQNAHIHVATADHRK